MKDETAGQHYQLVEKAIRLVRERFKKQPSLEELSGELGISPFHFQRIFSEWTGVSPKQFLQHTTLQFARIQLRQNIPVMEAAWSAGLSGSSRLHDLFVQIQAMTPGEYRQQGRSLEISYSFQSTVFGEVLCASTRRGICHLHFSVQREMALSALAAEFPRALIKPGEMNDHRCAAGIINGNSGEKLMLHLRGTDFQLQVWNALLQIPEGQILDYSQVALRAGKPGAARATGNAIGSNPVAWLIPCHRVLRSDGTAGGYRWGQDRKAVMLALEKYRMEKHSV